MPMLEQRLPTGVRRSGTRGGPADKRELVFDALGDLAKTMVVRSRPQQRFALDFGLKRRVDAEEVLAFWYISRWGRPGGGAYDGFLVRDWHDFKLFGGANGNSGFIDEGGGVWRAARVWRLGALTYLRPLRRIATDVPFAVYDGSGAPTAHTIDPATATGAISGAGPYTCSGAFDWPVTWLHDESMAAIELDGNVDDILHGFEGVELIETPWGGAPPLP